MARKKEMMPKLKEFHIRNNSVPRLDKFTKLKTLFPLTSQNELLLKCLDIGIAAKLNEAQPEEERIKIVVAQSEQRLKEIICNESKKIIDNTKTISIMLKIAEQMQSCALQSLLYFLQTQSIEIPATAFEQFQTQLLDVFEKQKTDYINKLFGGRD